MTLAADNQSWATALIEALALGGMDEVVVSPGSRSTPLVLALATCPHARAHVVLDERAAGFFALGLARARGRAVGLLCTSGSAAAHYLPAVIEASHSRVPLVVLSADRPAELQGVGAPQTIEQRGMFGPHARLSLDLVAPTPGASPRWLRTVAARALDAAHGSPSGPVHINVPFKKPLWDEGLPHKVEGLGAARVWRGPNVAPSDALDAVAARMAGAERGVIVCGPHWPRGGSEAAHARAAEIVSLARALGWPVLAEPASQLRFGHHDLGPIIASADALLRDEALGQRLAPELLVQLGPAPTSGPVGVWMARHGQDRTILIDDDGLWLDPHHMADTLLAADVAETCRGLRQRLAEHRPVSGWLAAWKSADEAAAGALAELCGDPGWEGAVARAMVEALPEGAMLHLASSMPIRDADSFCPTLARDLRVFSSRGANGIDGTLATALGESTAWGGPAALLVGDLAFLHDAGGLLTTGGRLTVVVINNGGGGIFGFLPIAAHPEAFERFFITPQEADLAALCAAAGARHRRLEGAGALAEALADDMALDGVGVIEVVVSRQENLDAHRRAWRAVSEAAGAALDRMEGEA